MSRSPSLRRLMREASELSTSPSPHFHAAPISDSNLYDWHFTLAGPPQPSPYAGGIYHGRIVLPPTYPLRPPSFRFLTPSGRFEVNREICLSISGHHEESWQPAWGIRTALIAIRSFMDGETAGQVGGLEGVSEEIKREWAGLSRGWSCEVCNGGKGQGEGQSNEEVLGEWRAFCVEQGVDVLREEEVEGVPEGLRIGVKKDKKDEEGSTGTSTSNSNATTMTQGTAGEKGTDSGGPTTLEKSASTPNGPALQSPSPSIARQGPPAVTSGPESQLRIPQQLQLQQHPMPTRTSTQAAPVASQDSAWLDRAIFGVLIALILMILRRVVNVED
ncbi:ubiquitin-conjugating enzyme/RWD-like protein [Aspergillus cavernicola]|uniref:Ubiquitin-conjugating enzyme/RWD-like protein n=1 Tax=Aspergillus cavernicola TaxID=176166 RepID=A0ABR4INK8_9EURO